MIILSILAVLKAKTPPMVVLLKDAALPPICKGEFILGALFIMLDFKSMLVFTKL